MEQTTGIFSVSTEQVARPAFTGAKCQGRSPRIGRTMARPQIRLARSIAVGFEFVRGGRARGLRLDIHPNESTTAFKTASKRASKRASEKMESPGVQLGDDSHGDHRAASPRASVQGRLGARDHDLVAT